MSKFFKRTWLEINIDAISNNYNKIKASISPGAKIMAVVKADAYGHGVEHVVRELSRQGADWFAVSNFEEAMQIRSAGVDNPVLILGYTPPKYAPQMALNGFSQTVFNSSYAKKIAEAAAKAGLQVNIHIKVDTGMSRLGFTYHDNMLDLGAVDEITEICKLENLYPEGIFTHFASADETGEGEVYTRLQFDLFLDIIERLKQKGITFELRHCCNSAATVRFPDMHLDMVRPGIILYGLSPSKEVCSTLGLTPAMELKTVISMIKKIDEGTPVSYGRAFTSEKEMLIATVPVGYADGYPRALSNKASMLIGGKRARVIGRVCMDQMMLDVTDIEGVDEGMTVTAFGRDGNDEISVDDLADQLGIINYEIVCGISKRVSRIYLRDGKIESLTDYMGVDL